MFKKIEAWILYLVLLLGILFWFSSIVLVRQGIEGITKAGKLNIEPLSKPLVYISRVPEQVLMELLSTGTQVNGFWEEQRIFYSQDGFVVNDENRYSTKEMYLLLSKFDGNLQEGIVELVDLRNFEVLHTWNPDLDSMNKLIKKNYEYKYLERDSNDIRAPLYHPLLTDDGGIVFGWNAPLRKIDHCSNLVFQSFEDKVHHSIEADIQGNIWASSYIFPQLLDEKKVGRKIREEGGFRDEGIVKLSPDGEILYQKSISEIFIENDLEYLLYSVGGKKFNTDPIHVNDIQPVNSDSKFWKKGDLFISLRQQSMVFLYRPSTNKIIWKGVGHTYHQHDVDILDNHRISIFNNNSKNFVSGNVVDGHNEVLIYDFETDEYISYLGKSMKDNDIRTITEGRNQILPNGDLFIEESNYGRSLYFNSDGSLKWSHVNRSSDGRVWVVAWSRIIYNEKDLENVRFLLKRVNECND